LTVAALSFFGAVSGLVFLVSSAIVVPRIFV
jgi:hypothetical protein